MGETIELGVEVPRDDVSNHAKAARDPVRPGKKADNPRIDVLIPGAAVET
jgi:hypothetical protein